MEYNGPIKAPIMKDEEIATLKVYVNDELEKEISLFSSETIKRSNIFSRLLTSLNYMVWGDV